VPRHLAIETAYARNVADPLVLDLDGRDWRLDPAINVGHLASLFTRFQDGLTSIGDDDQPMDARLQAMEGKRVEGINALTQCLAPEEREAFTPYALERIDVTVLAQIITWMLSEVSGQATPTQPPSSSNGSQADGAYSTDGAQPEASTPSPSPQTVPSTSTSTPSASTPMSADST
jgi:hypothetical protein